MHAQSNAELATMEPTAAGTAADWHHAESMDELLESIEAELALHEHELMEQNLDMADFEESIRNALDGLDGETQPSPEPAGDVAMPVEADVTDVGSAEEQSAATPEPIAEEAPAAAIETPLAERELVAALEPAAEHDMVATPAAATEEPAAAGESLEAVELELALHNQNLVSLGFEESIRTALTDIGGEMLFQMRIEQEDCQRIAAVRIGRGEEQQFALVIMPPGGGLMRVEPVEQSSNPLARITESYAGLMDTFRAAA